jgi:hypothetical protein
MAVPAGLTPEQAATWRAVVAARPIEWFDAGSAPLLLAYCRAVAAQATIAEAVDEFGPIAARVVDYHKLLDLQDAQAKIVIRLATGMRLTQHSRHSVEAGTTAARDGPSAAKLWERKK